MAVVSSKEPATHTSCPSIPDAIITNSLNYFSLLVSIRVCFRVLVRRVLELMEGYEETLHLIIPTRR